MNFNIKREDFIKLETFLFGLNFPCYCKIKICFIDSDEVFNYETIKMGNSFVLITKQGLSVTAAHRSLNQEPYSGNIISGEDDIGERLTANAEGTE